MRILMAVMALALLPQAVAAQRPQTLLDGDVDSGGFGGPMAIATDLLGSEALLAGGGGAWLIDHTFMIGGAGFGLVTPVDELAPAGGASPRRVDMGYGGLMLGYVNDGHRMVHWSLHVVLGAGGLSFRDDPAGTDPIGFLVAQPAMMLELNVTEFFRLAVGGAYRMVDAVDGSAGFTADDLEGAGVLVQFLFGGF